MDAIKEWDRKNLAPGMYEIIKDLYGEEEIDVSFTKEERVLLSRIVYTMLTPHYWRGNGGTINVRYSGWCK
jgi:hypothetical protein